MNSLFRQAPKFCLTIAAVFWGTRSQSAQSSEYKTEAEGTSKGAFKVSTHKMKKYGLLETTSQIYFAVSNTNQVLNIEARRNWVSGMMEASGIIRAKMLTTPTWTVEHKGDAFGFFPKPNSREEPRGLLYNTFSFWIQETGCCNAPDEIAVFSLKNGQKLFQTESLKAIVFADLNNGKILMVGAEPATDKSKEFATLILSNGEKKLDQISVKIDKSSLCCDLAESIVEIGEDPKNTSSEYSPPNNRTEVKKLFVKYKYDSGEIIVPTDGTSFIKKEATLKGGFLVSEGN